MVELGLEPGSLLSARGSRSCAAGRLLPPFPAGSVTARVQGNTDCTFHLACQGTLFKPSFLPCYPAGGGPSEGVPAAEGELPREPETPEEHHGAPGLEGQQVSPHWLLLIPDI